MVRCNSNNLRTPRHPAPSSFPASKCTSTEGRELSDTQQSTPSLRTYSPYPISKRIIPQTPVGGPKRMQVPFQADHRMYSLVEPPSKLTMRRRGKTQAQHDI